MAAIEGEAVIARPVDVVFDYVADQRNEPQYNPRMVRAEKVTEGPVGEGTIFDCAVAFAGGSAGMRVACTAYERPAFFASTARTRLAEFTVTLTFEAVPGGTRMRWSEQVWPRGALKPLAPVIRAIGRRQETAIWTSMKRHLEGTAAPRARRGPGSTPAPGRRH